MPDVLETLSEARGYEIIDEPRVVSVKMNPWLHSWFFSLLIVLLILGLMAGFGVLVYVVLCRIWGEDEDINEFSTALRAKRTEGPTEPTIRKAA